MSFLRKEKTSSALNFGSSHSHIPIEEPMSPTEQLFNSIQDTQGNGVDDLSNHGLELNLHFNSRYDEPTKSDLTVQRSPFCSQEESVAQSTKSSPRSSIVSTPLPPQTNMQNSNIHHGSLGSSFQYQSENVSQEMSRVPSDYKGFHAKSPKDTVPPLSQPIKPRFRKKNSLLGKLIHSRRDSEPKETVLETIESHPTEGESHQRLNHFQTSPNLLGEVSHKLGTHRHSTFIPSTRSSVSSTGSSRNGSNSKQSIPKGNKSRLASVSSDFAHHLSSELRSIPSQLQQQHPHPHQVTAPIAEVPTPPETSASTPTNVPGAFNLDMDLAHMAGIVSSPSIANLSTHTPLPIPSISRQASNINLGGWQAPDSWDVKFDDLGGESKSGSKASSISSPSSIVTAGSVPNDKKVDDSESTVPKAPKKDEELRTKTLTKTSGVVPATTQPKKQPNYTIRIFKEDNTFTTILCPLETTTTEIIAIVGRKFFLPSVSNYQISLKVGNGSKSLEPNEKPLKIQKYLLLLSGYTEKENLNIIGREDLSFLCKFVLEKNVLRGLTDEEESLISKDYVHVDIRNLNLRTIPIIFHQHAYEIETLDVSENTSIYLPLDFIQSCNNLKILKFAANRCSRFPINILEANKLTYLDLQRNFLRDVPSKISTLVHLKTLNLNCNQISSLPASISKLKLSVLNLSSNLFTTYPEPVSTLTTLVELDLSYNYLSTLSGSIANLTNLTQLNLSTNKLSKSLPNFLEHLISLKELDIRYNRLNNIDVLGSLPNLELLLSTKNMVSQFNDKMEKLRFFDFDRNPLTDLQFENILPSLTVLDLSKAKITSVPNVFLSKIPNIEKLVMDKNHLVAIPPEIGTLKHLVFLSIFANNLQSIPAEISQLTALQYLDLHANNLQKLPDEIWNLKALSVLNVSSNLLTEFPKPPPTALASISSSSNFRQLLTNVDKPRNNSEESGSSAVTPTSNSRRSSQQLTSLTNSNIHFTSIDATYKSQSAEASPGTSNDNSRRGSEQSQSPNVAGSTSFADSLLVLSAADNRLSDDCFEVISLLTELKTLNLSYNELLEIPYGALKRMNRLMALYLSGNELANLPTDDLEHMHTLRTLHLNNNKFVTLPAELGKIVNLQVLDVGSNQLKYNISNWPYDWNWHWNLELKYLNFSGNKRLEIRQNFNRSNEASVEDLDSFLVLKNLKVLGLIDVTLTTPSVPDQTVDTRVRTVASESTSLGYGIADTMGWRDNVTIRDVLSQKFRGNEHEALICLYDGKSVSSRQGDKVSKVIQESFSNIFSEELDKLKSNEVVPDALRRTFLTLNKEVNSFLSNEETSVAVTHRSSTIHKLNNAELLSGSCCTVIYVQDKKLYTANIGDTMALLSRGNGDHVVLTTKHDPTSRQEFERIRASGGFVSGDGKLDGVLEVSRAVGFFDLLPHVHAGPDISEVEFSSDDMLVIATKVLWDYVPFETAVDVIRQEKDDPMVAAQKLRDYAISYGATDKITVTVVSFGQQKSKNRFGGYSTNEDDMLMTKKRRDRGAYPEDTALRRLEGEIDPPVGEVALVFTDIKNSTLLWDTYPVAMRSAIKIHNAVMRRQLRIVGGYEVKTEGDAFMVSFPSPTSALLWTFNVQQSLLTADWPTEILESDEGCEITDNDGTIVFRGLSVRMGIHWGSPVCENDIITRRMDYFGPMVNRTARISSCADGGQIAVSSDFVEELRQIEACHYKVKSEQVSLLDAYGNDKYGAIIDREIASIEDIGYEVMEIGEKKLKGLETPEFVSLFYPKKLYVRYSMVRNEPSEEFTKSRIGGMLSLDMVYQLRTTSLRLESICSRLFGGAIERDPKTFTSFSAGTTQTLSKTLGEVEFVTFLDHLVTRVESSVALLEVRQNVSRYKGTGALFSSSEENINVVGMLNELSEMLKFAYEMKGKRE